ncbi:MAG: SPASM domain-containing protein [Planctomycetota bacterium]
MSPPKAIALIVADPTAGRLGHARRLDAELAGRPVLWHTLHRAARIGGIDRIVVVHPPGRSPMGRVDPGAFGVPVEALAHDLVVGDAFTPRLRSARRWALSGWRGGLGGATAWDELLPAAPLAAAMEKFGGDAAVLVGGDWCGFDPGYATQLLELHLGAPEGMKLTFTQAPPGLSPIVTSRAVLADLAQNQATFGGLLAYNPRRPALDPIGREVNLPIPATVRDTARRFIADTDAGSLGALGRAAEVLGNGFVEADAVAITDACRAWESEHPDHVFDTLPPQVTVELTPRRIAHGPVTPQHDVAFDRDDMDAALARDLFAQLSGRAVTLGGLGDATLHPRWADLAAAALDAGVMGLHVETDLLAERAALEPLTDVLGGSRRLIDIVSVNLNADTAATYEKAMGVDRFGEVIDTLQWLFDRRGARARNAETGEPSADTSQAAAGVPWVVPRLVKTLDTLPDMESFFERWVHLVGHAVIQRPPNGGTGRHALAPDRSPVPMDPPWKPPSPHQVKHRLTVLSDGTVTLCGQDWLGRAALGNVRDAPLLDLWRRAAELDLPGETDDSPVCRRCRDWWSIHRRSREAVAAM